MPKLTADLIEQAAQYTNALKEREIDLRGKYYRNPCIFDTEVPSCFIWIPFINKRINQTLVNVSLLFIR